GLLTSTTLTVSRVISHHGCRKAIQSAVCRGFRSVEILPLLPMKKLLTISILFAAFNSSWALPVYDPFSDATAGGGTSYTVGTGLAGNNTFVTNDWTLVNSGSANLQEPFIVATNLTYPNLPTSSGNAISNTGPFSAQGRSARLNLRATTS